MKKKKLIKLLDSQYRTSVIGEMVDSVAHQWTQPISIISLYVKMIEDDFKYGEIDKNYLKDINSKVDNQVNFMLETLETFRNFLKPKNKSEYFDIIDSVETALSILQDVLQNNQIRIAIDFKDMENKIFGSKIELANVIINLLNNAKDSFIKNGIENRDMIIQMSHTKKITYLMVKDNAGGIPHRKLNKIFKPNFTTKKKGSGIGLYLSKRLVKKMNGKIKAENIANGVTFTIKFSK